MIYRSFYSLTTHGISPFINAIIFGPQNFYFSPHFLDLRFEALPMAQDPHMPADIFDGLLDDAGALLAPQPPAWPVNPILWPGDPALFNVAPQYPPGLMPGYYNMPPYPVPFAGGPAPYVAAHPAFPYAPAAGLEQPVMRRPDGEAARRGRLPEGEGYWNTERHPLRETRRIKQQELDDARTQIQDLERVNESLIEELEEYRRRQSANGARGRTTSPGPRHYRHTSPRRTRSPLRRRAISQDSRDEDYKSRDSSPSPSASRTRSPSPTRARSRSRSAERRTEATAQVNRSTRTTTNDDSPVPPNDSHGAHTLASRISPVAPPPYSAAVPRANRTPHRGANKPRNMSSWALHGPWMTFNVDTVEDAKTLFAAAEHDDQALLYLDYCNSTFQAPGQRRTEGIQYLISRWNWFLGDQRDRRDYLRSINAVPFRPAGTRSRKSNHADTHSSEQTVTPAPTEAMIDSPVPAPSVPHVNSTPTSPLSSPDQSMEESAADTAMEDGEWANFVPPVAPWLSPAADDAGAPAGSPPIVPNVLRTVTPPQSSEDERLDYGDGTDSDEP